MSKEMDEDIVETKVQVVCCWVHGLVDKGGASLHVRHCLKAGRQQSGKDITSVSKGYIRCKIIRTL